METYLLCLVLGFIFKETSANECKSISTENIEFKRCPTNCSQYNESIAGNHVFFNCSIGVKKDVDVYKERNAEQFLPKSSIFDAPKILGVETYLKKFSSSAITFEQCLKINFSLPKGVFNPENVNDWWLPKAVLLKFEGLPSNLTSIEDSFYTKCSRERIFQFHNYKAPNFYEMANPKNPIEVFHKRKLEFDCLIGLDGSGYVISLQTAEGKTARYITTVTDIQSRWRPTIMTYLNDSSYSLYIVVQKPTNRNITGYSVQLVHNGYSAVQTAKINVQERNSTMFFNLTRGQYRVVVKPICKTLCGKNETFTVKSVPIDGSKLPWNPKDKDSPHYLEDTLEPMKVAAMVTGCIMGVTLLLAITYCIRRRPKCQESDTVPKISGLLLHPFRNDSISGEYDVVLKLEQYVNRAFDCTITNSSDILREQSSHSENLKSRVDRYLKECSFVLVLTSNGCFKANATDLDRDFYSCVLKAAVERKRVHNDIRIIPIRFGFNSDNDLSALLSTLDVTVDHVLDFIITPSKVYSKIHNQEKNLQEENRSKWSYSWTELIITANNVRNNHFAEQNENEPLLSPDSQIKPRKQFSTLFGDNIENQFRKVMEMNMETESMLGEDNFDSKSEMDRLTDDIKLRQHPGKKLNRPHIEQPASFSPTLLCQLQQDKDAKQLKNQENHQYPLHREGHCKRSEELNAFNVESNSDSFSDDSVGSMEIQLDEEIGEEMDQRIHNKHIRPPVLHCSVNHRQYHLPHHCQNREMDHRLSIHRNEIPDYHQNQSFHHHKINNHRGMFDQRHLTDDRSHHTHRDVISHQRLHSAHQYRPDDNISGNVNHQNGSLRMYDQPSNLDRSHFLPPDEDFDLNEDEAFELADKLSPDFDHDTLHHPNDRIPTNCYRQHPIQLRAHRPPDIGHHSQHHQHNLSHPHHFQGHEDFHQDSGAHYNDPGQHSLHETQCSDGVGSSRFSFEAVDPRAAKQEQSDQTGVLKTRPAKYTEKPKVQTQRTESVPSLPSDIHFGNVAENFQNYSPVPPEEIDNISESQIINGFLQINKKNT